MSLMSKVTIFACGTLFGTTGLKILGSKDAKKVYTYTTAAALRYKDDIMKAVTVVRENVDDIVADAKVLNEERAKEEKVIEDTSETVE